jgi:soluble lytic murein transglycosylase-like protein
LKNKLFSYSAFFASQACSSIKFRIIIKNNLEISSRYIVRLLALVLNILLGSSILVQSSEIWAASMDTKANKNNHQRGHTTRSRGKSKTPQLLTVKQKRLQNPGDVWERIRSGMQIPRPSPVQTLQDQILEKNNSSFESSVTQTRLHTRIGLQPDDVTTSNTTIPLSEKARSERILALQKIRQPISASASIHNYANYTPYGRLKLNAALSSRIRKNTVLQEQLFASKNGDQHGIAAGQTRLRTRIEFHPKLRGIDSITSAEPLISSTSPLAKHVKTNRLGKSVITSYATTAQNGQSAADLIPNHNNQATKYERVNKHIVWYTQHRDYLRQVAERARPYLFHIVESLSKNKLPHELALLPIVESAYQPTAQSPKSAAGLWQFIPSTGKDFNLHQSEQYDARLDIAASTQAAIRYLSFLKQHFNGDWLLALAAYNCGLGTVDDAIGRNIAEGLATDYWSLRLPEETQEYVPRFLALSSIFANPSAHGLKLAPVRNEPYFIKVKIDRKYDIKYLADKDFREIAQLANLSYEQFSRLNPGYLNPKLATDGPFTFLMPADNANQLHQRLASIAQFLNESPVITASHAPLKRRALPTIDEQKTALSSLLTDITLPKGADLVKDSDPFLSLNLDTNQTTPRIVNQSVIPTADLNSGPKQVKKNI